MASKSKYEIGQLPVARIIHTSLNGDGSGEAVYKPEIISWKQVRECAYCKIEFQPSYVQQKMVRFCGKSCSAKWRMRQPENLERVHNPEVHAKAGRAISAWLKTEAAKPQIERIRNLNPMSDPACRKKVSDTLKAMGHKPCELGGNGRGATTPQKALIKSLCGDWIMEYAVSLGKRRVGYPTCYKIDIANVKNKVAIEVDGNSHHSRKAQDEKKDEMLISLGWTVLRFWNCDIMAWKKSGMPKESHISVTLAKYGIKVNR